MQNCAGSEGVARSEIGQRRRTHIPVEAATRHDISVELLAAFRPCPGADYAFVRVPAVFLTGAAVWL